MTATTHLAWPPTPDNAADWIAAANGTSGGDLGADNGPVEEVLSGWDADRRCDAEENARWRRSP